MAYQYVLSDSITAIGLGTIDSVFVKGTAALIVSGGPAINGTGSHHTAVVEGEVVSEGNAITLGDSTSEDEGESVIVGEGGFVRGENNGVVLTGINSHVLNRGDISAFFAGVSLVADFSVKNDVVNFGHIDGSRAVTSTGTGSFYLTNYGTVSGDDYSYFSNTDGAYDRVVNKGVLIGAVDLGGGDDLYNGRDGRIEGSINAGAGNDTVRAGADDDFIVGDSGNDFVFGYGGDDFILGAADNDTLRGGDGDDVLAGGNGASEPDGDDVLIGGDGADTMYGGGGSDLFFVNDAGDVVFESNIAGADTVESLVSFSLNGIFVEFLTLKGSAAITGTGNGVANTITGNTASNVIFGKGGNDTLSGGGGADGFVFDASLSSSANVDTITDFNAIDDVIRLSKAVFNQVAGAGTLTAAQFKANVNGVATEGDDRIVYETDTGKLFYDNNGSLAGGVFQIALLSGAPALSNADFVLF